tara:strand:+ start:1174 stop:1665 length:492 start_codon:yes stop_codon:yes gene_type:complete
MLSKKLSNIFQDYMPDNICFGCGKNTKNGLHIKSYWNGKEAECIWFPKPYHQGWSSIMNGGIIATIIDCHCMGTAMAYAYKKENRSLNSLPEYRYATGTITVKYIAPTPNKKVKLSAKIISYSEKKIFLKCHLISENKITVSAEVVAFRVYDSGKETKKIFAI